jgi:short-subunit dehydrogenase
MMDVQLYANQKSSVMQQMLDTNVYQYTDIVLLQKFLHVLIARKRRSALIAVSSVVSAAPLPGMFVYASTKAFVNYLVYAV